MLSRYQKTVLPASGVNHLDGFNAESNSPPGVNGVLGKENKGWREEKQERDQNQIYNTRILVLSTGDGLYLYTLEDVVRICTGNHHVHSVVRF